MMAKRKERLEVPLVLTSLIEEALAFAKAKERLVASAPDTWAALCSLSGQRLPEHPGIVVMFLDRTQGNTPENATHSTAIFALRDEEVALGGVAAINAIVDARVGEALARLRPCKLYDSPSDAQIAQEITHSLAVLPQG